MSGFNLGKITEMAGKVGGVAVAGGVTLIGGSWLFRNATYTVDAGQRAIKFHRLSGVGKDTYQEGFHVLMPWFEKPIIFDIKARPHTMTSLTGSRDLQMVNISLRALVRPDETALTEIYRMLGMDFDDKVLPSIVNEVLKSVVAQYNASQLITQRDMVSRMVRQRLKDRAADFHILLDDVAITHLSFSPEYEKAIEAKQVAQQQSEKAKYLVLKAQEEKKRVIIHAEGEKVAAQMIGDSIKSSPGFIELRRIAVAKEVASNLQKSSNRMVLSTDQLMLNLMGAGTGATSAAQNLLGK